MRHLSLACLATTALPLAFLALAACNAEPEAASPAPEPAAAPTAPASTASTAAPTAAPQVAATYTASPATRDVFWGDTHLHTSDSPDAFAFGTRLGAREALRFARGETVTATGGMEATLTRPLDFLVISDHGVALGLMNEIYNDNPALTSDPVIAGWRDDFRAGGDRAAITMRKIIQGHSMGTNPDLLHDRDVVGPIARGIWQKRGDLIDAYNEPGVFSAFVGYEWTPAPNGDNLHRVVVFRDPPAVTNAVIPFNSDMSADPEDLWAFLEAYERDRGGNALAIPHNSNLSGGLMFATTDMEGNAIDADYARTRMKWEPIVEATQYKGDSETTSFLSPNDEFADFGNAGWTETNLIGRPRGTDTHAGSYMRPALQRGLRIEAEVGENPFKFGMIGATDSHTGLATADEDNFFGKYPTHEPDADRASRAEAISSGNRIGWQYLASGLAGVWAEANTREAIFDAMERKEVYATTGPRMRVRMFAGYDFTPDDLGDIDAGYARGVPMGGDLARSDTPPVFLVTASQDPESGPLERIQVIKLTADSETIYDAARNADGAAELSATWSDPDFDPDEAATYYARVLQVPTPHWSQYDRERFDADIPEDAPETIIERAYTSPVWYTP